MKKPDQSSSLASRAGFTLLEILVSSIIMVIIIGMLFQILIGTMNAFDNGTARLQINSDVRMALDLISRDLQSMVVRQTANDQEWLVSGPLPVDAGIADLNSTWLTFFAPSVDRDAGQQGDIVAVSYRNALQDPISMSDVFEVFGLYKQMASTQDTFVEALGVTNIITDYWLAGGSAPDAVLRPGFLVPNVVKFEVSWWADFPTQPTLRRLGPEYTVRLSNVLNVTNPGDTAGTDYPGAVLEAADISLTILDDEGMGIARSLDVNGNLTKARLDDLVQKYGRVETIRVAINY